MAIDMNKLNKNQKLDESGQAEAKPDTENKSGNSKKAAQNTRKTKAEQAVQQTEETHGICVLTYIANGIWVDQNGAKWSASPVDGTNIKNVRKYSKNDYDSRSDLKFMVKYGSMTLTIV